MPRPRRSAADALQEEIYRRMTPAQRVRIAIELSELLFEFKKAGLRHQHPEMSEAEIMREFVREVHGLHLK
jgi:Rv0078B-related antitoxin